MPPAPALISLWCCMSLADALQRIHARPVQTATHGVTLWYLAAAEGEVVELTACVGPITAKDEEDQSGGRKRRSSCTLLLSADDLDARTYRTARVYLEDPATGGKPWAVAELVGYSDGEVIYRIEQIESLEKTVRGHRK
jgi:hypothetical protein